MEADNPYLFLVKAQENYILLWLNSRFSWSMSVEMKKIINPCRLTSRAYYPVKIPSWTKKAKPHQRQRKEEKDDLSKSNVIRLGLNPFRKNREWIRQRQNNKNVCFYLNYHVNGKALKSRVISTTIYSPCGISAYRKTVWLQARWIFTVAYSEHGWN